MEGRQVYSVGAGCGGLEGVRYAQVRQCPTITRHHHLLTMMGVSFARLGKDLTLGADNCLGKVYKASMTRRATRHSSPSSEPPRTRRLSSLFCRRAPCRRARYAALYSTMPTVFPFYVPCNHTLLCTRTCVDFMNRTPSARATPTPPRAPDSMPTRRVTGSLTLP